MDDVETYVNKLFIKLGFGELGVNLSQDQYTFEVGGTQFIYEPVIVGGGGQDFFPEFENGWQGKPAVNISTSEL